MACIAVAHVHITPHKGWNRGGVSGFDPRIPVPAGHIYTLPSHNFLGTMVGRDAAFGGCCGLWRPHFVWGAVGGWERACCAGWAAGGLVASWDAEMAAGLVVGVVRLVV